MKIVCDSCGAKYSIADEKVAGKIFKIRCKKCSSVLEVRGDHDEAPAEDPATVVYDQRNEAIWYVVVEGEQQGPLAPTQLMGLFAKGSISLDSYVWQEGFDDWKVAKDVAELAELLGGSGAGQASAEPVASDETSAIGTGGDLFGSGADEPEAEAQPAGNMFAAFDASASSAEAQEPAAETSSSARNEGAAQQVAAPQKMTGQRNENSVLFSLGNLQQLAAREPAAGEPAPAQAASAQPRPAAAASGEGSGLIDIRALAQATGSEGQRSAAADDLLNLGSSVGIGAGTLGGPLLGPVPEEKSGRGPWIWVGGGAVSLLLVAAVAILGFVVFKKDSPPEAQFEVKGDSGAAPAVGIGEPQGSAPAAAAQMPEDPDRAEPELDDSEEPAEDALADAEEPTEAPSLASANKPATKSTRRRRSSSTTTSTKTTQAAPAPKPKSNNLDALMDEVIGGSSSKEQKKSSSSSSSGSNLPTTPSRDDVKRALTGVSGAVRSCAKGDSGTATVSVTFSGSTGRASSTKVVSGPFKGTPVGSCIEKAAKRARVPRFKQSTFNVKFPYRL